ncbi:FecCD family ABC transporter permease [Paenibacillus soyae]|uniref:Iron ABC transporter permease n=1 Tax=Paenibacillus soyae TaxID=2969249 RepID=A0A9X2MPV8_9BACL|nr:iron ABC transporter permease [Paenibacillus soyae]MCR2804669.1 iron ABC transporter permease [Paenibacillus soyae]
MSKHRTFRSAGRARSLLPASRAARVTVVLSVICLAAIVICTGTGSQFISPYRVLQAIFGQMPFLQHLFGEAPPMDQVVVTKLRLPRIVIAVLIGASLAVAGAILQGVIRNPLASPDVIGITEGASFGAVMFIFLFAGSVSIHWMPFFAIAGAILITALLYALAWKKGVSPLRLVLIGIGVSAAVKSVSYMLIIAGPLQLADRSLTFMAGSIYGMSWDKDVLTLLPWVLVLLPAAWVQARHVDIQALGDQLAGSVGAHVQKQRLLLIGLSVALAGAAISIGGAIAFIGLMAPHMARRLVGPSFRYVMPVSALVGAILLLTADLVARTAFLPRDVPAGVFTAAIGAPFFLYLLYRNRNRY